MNPLHSTALQLAAAGLPVFPVIPKSKAPAVQNGFLAATTDLKVVDNWWGKKGYSIGIAVPEGMIVVDFDALAHESIEGNPDMPLPDTVRVKTPGKGGGLHLYYKLPPGIVIGPKVKPMPGMDIRTKGSYVVAPPSTHPDGGCYQWEDGSVPDPRAWENLPYAPSWIIEGCQSGYGHKDEDREKVNILDLMKGVEPGSRQVALFRAAAHMRHRQFSKEEACVVLDGIAKASEGSGYKKWPDIPALVNRVWRRYEAPPRGSKQGPAKGWVLSDLVREDLGATNWYVDSLLAPGLGIIVSDSGAGKSMCIADLCLSVATRELVWGRFKVPRARGVLYLDLEQNPKSAQDRWRKMLGDRVPPENIKLYFEWPRMEEGGLEKIVEELQANPEIEMVVIDILSLFWPSTQEGVNAYHGAYNVLGKLRKVANDYGILFLLVHHTNAAGGYSGGTAMKGALDYKFELSREQGAVTGSMHVWGKNIEARNLLMSVDLNRFRWKVEGMS